MSVKLTNVKLSKALSVILESVAGKKGKLIYAVDSGVITISATGGASVEDSVRKTYDIRFLLPEKLEAGAQQKRISALREMVVESIDPASWGDHNGKLNTVTVMDGTLVVVQTERNQNAIENFIKHLQELMASGRPN